MDSIRPGQGGDMSIPESFGTSSGNTRQFDSRMQRIDQQRVAIPVPPIQSTETGFRQGQGGNMSTPMVHTQTPLQPGRVGTVIPPSAMAAAFSRPPSVGAGMHTGSPLTIPPNQFGVNVGPSERYDMGEGVDATIKHREARALLERQIPCDMRKLSSPIGMKFIYPVTMMTYSLYENSRFVASAEVIPSRFFDFTIQHGCPTMLGMRGEDIREDHSQPTKMRQECSKRLECEEQHYRATHQLLLTKAEEAKTQLADAEYRENVAFIATKVMLVVQALAIIIVAAASLPLGWIAIPLIGLIPSAIAWWIYSNRVDTLNYDIAAPLNIALPKDTYNPSIDLDCPETRERVLNEFLNNDYQTIAKSPWTLNQMWGYNLFILRENTDRSSLESVNKVWHIRETNRIYEAHLALIDEAVEESKSLINDLVRQREKEILHLSNYGYPLEDKITHLEVILENNRSNAISYVNSMMKNMKTALKERYEEALGCY